MANLKKILIIDDDLSIRFVLKKILSRQLSNVDIFSSEDGVQGVGYAFVLKPDLIVIDSTLPKYSGRELVDFISTNENFRVTPIILLHEDDSFIDRLPSNFIQISKADSLFPESLVNEVIKEVGNVDDEPHKERSIGLINFLSRKIIGYSNSSFVNANNSRKGNVFKRISNSLKFYFNQILVGFYLSLFFLLVGRKENEVNIDQKQKDQVAYRSKIYPAVGVSVALTLFITLHLFITLGGILTFGFLGTKIVNAASYTWDGGGDTGSCGAGNENNWSCAQNWSSDIVPTSLDTVTFNGTSSKDSVVDAGFGGTVTSVTLATGSGGYGGTVSQQRTLVITSTLNISAGIYSAADQSLTVTGGFALNTGGTFTASSGLTTFSAGFTINGGTFNHNGGTINYDGGAATLACNNITFNLVSFNGLNNGAKTISSNCTLPLGNNPVISRTAGQFPQLTLSGTLSGTGTLSTNDPYTIIAMQSTAVLNGFTNLNLGNLTLNGATLSLVNSLLVTNGLVVNSGSISGLGSYTSSNTTTINGGSVDFSSTVVDLNNGFTMTGGTFTAPSGTMYIAGSLTISGASVFNSNGGTINFDGFSGTLSCNNVVFSAVVLSVGRTINSNCSLPIGNNPVISSTVTLSGILTGSGSITLSAGSLTLNSGAVLTGFSSIVTPNLAVAGANIDFTSYSSIQVSSTTTLSSGSVAFPTGTDLNGSLVISGGTFNAPSGNMFLAGALTITGTPTFNHNGGTLTLDGSTATLSCNNVTFNLVVDGHTSGAKTYNSNCTIPMGNNPNLNNTVMNGTISGTGNLVMNSNLQLNAGAVLSGFSGINGIGGVLIIAGATLDASTYSTFTVPAFSISSGIFTAPVSMNVLSSFTISGGTFNHNNGTIIFSSGSTGVISCNNATIFNVQFTSGAGINKTVSSNCSLPLGNNPVVTNALTVAGTLTGSGTLNLNSNGNVFNAGATFTGFSAMVSNAFTVAGATLDFSAFTSFQQNNTVTVNSGSLSLPNNSVIANTTALTGGTLTFNGSADLNGALTISGGTFNASSGITYLGAGLTISGAPVFNHNNGTITFDGGTSTLSCNNVVFNLVTLNFGAGTKTISSNCSLPLGNNPTITSTTGAAVTVNGTLTGSGTLTYSNGTLTFNTGSNLTGFNGLSIRALTVAGATVDFSAYSLFNMTSGSSSVILSSGSLALPTVGADINGNLTISGGTFTAPSGILTLAGALTISGTPIFNHNNGTIVLDSAANPTISCNNVTFNRVEISNTLGSTVIASNCNLPLGNNPVVGNGGSVAIAGGTLSGTGTISSNTPEPGFLRLSTMTTANLSGFTGIDIGRLELASSSNIDFSSYTTFNVGTLNTYGGSTIVAAPVMNIRDIAYISGTFSHNNGTVILTDTNNILSSPQTGTDLTFFNLEKETGGSITFPRYSEFSKSVIVQGNMMLKGTSSSTLTLQSNLPDSQWKLEVQGTSDVEYLDVQDSNNIGNVIQASGRNIIDSGNNLGWNFNNPVVTDISIANSTNGNTNDSTPTINFNVSDPTITDTVKYQIQIDNNSDFSSAEVDFTSSLEAQGARSYTVTTALPDGSYYLRIKGLDSQDGDGGFVNYNSGNTFRIDTLPPTGNLFLGHVTDSTNPDIYIISSTSDASGVTQMIYSENPEFSDAIYIPYKQSDLYTLSSGYGTKTIYIKFKDAAGNESIRYSASINYTETPEEDVVESDPDTIVDEGTVGDGLVSVAFRILDSNRNPVSNLTLKLVQSDIEATTDENGVAVFNEVVLGNQFLLGVYNNEEFSHEIEVTESDKVITIVLEGSNSISPIVVVGLVLVVVAMGGVIIYLIRRKPTLS